jgi:hypothetical protein
VKRIEFKLKDGVAQLNASSLTAIKIWISSPPFIKVLWTSLTCEEKYGVLMKVFQGSRLDVPIPNDTSAKSKEILKELGSSSWKKYYNEGRHCSIRFDPGKEEYCITPMIFLVDKTSLYGIKEGVVCVSSDANPEVLISSLEAVLDSIPRLTEEYYNRE